MSIRTTGPGLTDDGQRPRRRLRSPSPDTLVLLLLLVIAMVAASIAGLALGTS
jgi:hypothetical protein